MSITLVSAFFDIGREKYNFLPRSKEKYVNDFKRWARIQNDLIFYCDNKVIGDTVMEIRKSFGREKNTTVIVTDIFEVDPILLKQMEEVEKNEDFLEFRKIRNTPENKANYNYVMLMKYWCTYNAASVVKDKTTQLAWFDFGYEHGGETFENEEDYNFLWDYDFNGKITLFRLPYEEKRPIFKVIQTIHPDSVMGSLVIMPVSLAEEFYICVKNAMQTICDVGFIDDDQLLLLMASRKMPPDKLQVLESFWFRPIKDFGGSHFELKKPEKLNIFQRLKRKIRYIKHKLKTR